MYVSHNNTTQSAIAEILIVEDEILVAEDIQTRLQELGYGVSGIASSGEDALKIAHRKRPNLVLMDIVLKGNLNGIDTAHFIRTRFNIPVIYLTAYSDNKTIELAKKTEPFGYIVKPLNERELHTTIELALYKHSVEMQLKESEQWLATTLRCISDAVIASDRDEFITFINPVAERLTGWTQNDALGKQLRTIFSLVCEDPTKKIANPIDTIIEKKVIVPLPDQSLLQTKDGNCLPVDGGAAPIQSGKDTLTGIVLTFRDISLQKQSEEALRKSEKKFRDIVENSLEWIWEVNCEGVYTEVSPIVEKILGYDAPAIVGTPYYQFFHPDEQEQMRKEIAENFERKQSFREIIIRHVHKNGTTVWLSRSGIPIFDSGGNLVGYRGADMDVTERIKSEKALLEEEERFRRLSESSYEAISFHDRGTILDVNSRFVNLFGYEYDELIGINALELAAPESRELIKQHIKNNYEKSYEAIGLRKDGSTFIGELHGREMPFKGRMVRVVAIRDITHRKQTELKLTESYQKLKNMLNRTVEALAIAVEKRDPYTSGHQFGVTQLTIAIARELDLHDDQIEGIRVASIVHDIGKISIAAEILNKPARLTDIEMELVKTHAQVGYDILRNIEFPWPVAEIVLQHHERLNGQGYPHGLKSQDILLEAKILAVADVVEAMASHRPYRSALGVEQALGEITRHKGLLYDDQVVDICVQLFMEKGFQFTDKKYNNTVKGTLKHPAIEV